MICPQCKQTTDSTQFCTRCGYAIANASINSTTTPQPSSTPMMGSTQMDPTFSAQSKSRVANILRAVVGIALVGFVIYSRIDDRSVTKNNAAIDSYNAGDRTQAVQQFKDAVAAALSDEKKASALINLGYAYTTDYQNEEALAAFKEANSLTRPNSFENHLTAAEVALLEKDPKKAEQEYLAAYALRKDDIQINNALGLFYLDLDEVAPDLADAKKAIPYLQQAFKVSPEEYVKLNLGLGYFANKNYTETVNLLKTSDFKIEPYAAFWLGLSYMELNDEASARFYLQKAKENGVSLPEEIETFLKK